MHGVDFTVIWAKFIDTKSSGGYTFHQFAYLI